MQRRALDRVVVLGLVTLKKPKMEIQEELRQRLQEASRFIPFGRLAIGTKCGFASPEEGNLITPADQEAKLGLVAQTARDLWREKIANQPIRLVCFLGQLVESSLEGTTSPCILSYVPPARPFPIRQ